MPIYEKLMGNPFVDAGVSGICEWLGRSVQPEDITITDLEKVVDDVAPMMQTKAGWKNLYSIFPNSILTNSAYRNQNRVELFKKECKNYLDTMLELSEAGDCMGCGRRTSNTHLSRTNIPLTGSGKLRNFYPTFDKGAGYCSACAFAVQLSPLTFMATGGKFLILHSNSWSALRSWAWTSTGDIRQQHLQQQITGCYNPGYTNPRNGLFYMVRKMVEFQELRSDEDITMQVYCFTNYNQNPELEVFHIPTPVFQFLRYVYQGEYITEWQKIVRSGYRKVNWSKVKSEDDYKNRANRVYENLLQDRSILGYFLHRSHRATRGNWKLMSLYLKEVRTMEQAQLDKIKQVGDLIAECIRKSGRDRRLVQLERASNYADCRNILRYVIRDRIQQGESEPLFSVDDYVEYLFPTSDHYTATPWRETRDLILFRLYETLHDWLQEQGYVEFDEDNDENNTADSDNASI